MCISVKDGGFDSEVWLGEPSPLLVESGPIANSEPWRDLYEGRGCKTPRDKRRMDRALSCAFNSLQVGDDSVVQLLGNLAVRSLASPVRDEILRLVKAHKTAATLFGSGAGTPSWECLRKMLGVKVDPNDYIGREKLYASDIQLVKLLAKYPFEGAEAKARTVAVEKLLNQEVLNARTNYRWATANFDEAERRLIEEVNVQLEQILGPAPTPDEVLSNAAWGPGTVEGYSFGGTETGPEMKFAARQTCTPNLVPVSQLVVDYYPAWKSQCDSMGRHNWLSVVSGDTLFTVPKKFEEHRCAMKQPSLNIWLSRGVGVTIRKRLQSRSGLDLLHQQAVNKELARIGSATGVFATLDLTSASDSNCRTVLRSVISPEWFAWCYSTASREFRFNTAAPGDPATYQTQQYQMMSSMGCGYTFELETAVFLAICRSVVPAVYATSSHGTSYIETPRGVEKVEKRIVRKTYPHIGVNGDDIIVPTAYATKVIEALVLFGFTINKQKSHYSPGPGFRESCGGDYLNGVPVRPLYITKRLENGAAIVTLANRVLEVATESCQTFRGFNNRGADWYFGLHTRLVGNIPRFMRDILKVPFTSPSGLWDTGNHDASCFTPTGQPVKYRTLVPSVIRWDLEKKYFWFDPLPGKDQEVWLLRCNGDNLLAARLSQLAGDPSEPVPRWADVPVGVGRFTVIRDSVYHEVGKTSPVGVRQWLGWVKI